MKSYVLFSRLMEPNARPINKIPVIVNVVSLPLKDVNKFSSYEEFIFSVGLRWL
jgi:hypothetical protein